MSELSEAINEMRNMRESYDQIGAAAEAYNTGKTELAANINAKGVQASASETLPELAQKVAQIAQETTIYDGADSYGKQIGADGSLWDLYQVLADMKTRFLGTGDYAALIVCEYYKGYDSLVLQGADGYYTCDGDYYDYASPTHVWHDADNGKANRWVAFLYRDDGARLDITNTAISPRSIYIGGHIGTIEYFVNGRLTELVCGVEETDVVDNLLLSNYTQAWNNTCVVRNVKAGNTSGVAFYIRNNVSLILETESDINITGNALNATAQYITWKGIKKIKTNGYAFELSNTIGFSIPDIEELDAYNNIIIKIAHGTGSNLSYINAPKLRKQGIGSLVQHYSSTTYNLIDVIVGVMETNLNCKDWNPTNVLADATKKAQLIDNIKNHILARVSDVTGGTQLVFTVSTNMYNNIASEQIEWQGETMSLADAFLTKNWLLAGA